MNRRTFLKTLGFGTAALLIPLPAVTKPVGAARVYDIIIESLYTGYYTVQRGVTPLLRAGVHWGSLWRWVAAVPDGELVFPGGEGEMIVVGNPARWTALWRGDDDQTRVTTVDTWERGRLRYRRRRTTLVAPRPDDSGACELCRANNLSGDSDYL